MKEMKTLKLPNQEEAYEIVDAYARESISNIKQIPEVTEEDNGKFLIVVNGVWTPTSIPIAEEMSF